MLRKGCPWTCAALTHNKVSDLAPIFAFLDKVLGGIHLDNGELLSNEVPDVFKAVFNGFEESGRLAKSADSVAFDVEMTLDRRQVALQSKDVARQRPWQIEETDVSA